MGCQIRPVSVYFRFFFTFFLFFREEEYDWLLPSSVLFPSLLPLLSDLRKEEGDLPSILVLGCGNSTLSSDLREAGFGRIASLDFSPTVIERMQDKHPDMRWVEGDMMSLEDVFGDEVCRLLNVLLYRLCFYLLWQKFDAIIDKAGIDALMVNEGDVWNPDHEG